MGRNIRGMVLWTVILMAALLSGCGKTEKKQVEPGLDVVCTVFPCYDLARAAVGGEGTVTMLISPGAEAHNYDPTPTDILKIRNCDVFVCIGGESEVWAETILSSLDGDVQVIRLIDCVQALQEEHTADMTVEAEHETEHEETELDEHIWTSPKNMQVMLDALTDALCAAAPDSESEICANSAAYRAELTALDEDFQAAASAGHRKKLVFGDRFPFLYFVRAYGLDYAAAFPGCSSATEPSVVTVAALLKVIQDENIPVIFKLEMSNGRVAQTLSDETGAQVLTFHSCHNVTGEEFAAGETYVSLMRKNLANLKIALQ